MKKFSPKQVHRSILHINKIVERESPQSAYAGLVLAATALAGLLDVYAQPNDKNPQGMTDDPREFRQHFAQMIQTLPILKKKVKLH
jgi:hypothetical protein